MTTCEVIIDQAQERLHDDGSLWPRDELLRWLNDGYRNLLAQSHACVRPEILDVPPRYAWVGTSEWEAGLVGGTFRHAMKSSGRSEAMYQWEVEFLEDVTPTNSLDWVAHLWERAYVGGDIDDHFRFGIAKDHTRSLKVYWDGKQLAGASTKELDQRDTSWWNESGEPIIYFKGNGRERSIEIFEAVTTYNQPFEHKDFEVGGIPRRLTGSRTYSLNGPITEWTQAYTGGGDVDPTVGFAVRITTERTDEAGTYYMFDWEAEVDDSDHANTYVQCYSWEYEFSGDTETQVGAGLLRLSTSPDRTYTPAPHDGSTTQPIGAIRRFASSDDSVLVFDIITNPRPLTELDSPVLVPAQFAKYLRAYVLSRAFGRKGEGQNPALASHYFMQYNVGVALLSALGNPTMMDRVFARDDTLGTTNARPLRVRFPSTYPQPEV